MAVALQRQVITLYGPTTPSWTTTYNIPEIAIEADAHKSDSREPPSSTDSAVTSRSLSNITADQVLAAIRRGIQQSTSHQRITHAA